MVTIEKIYEKKDYFKEISWDYLDQCLRCYDKNNYLSCAVWAALFLESLLKDCLVTAQWNIMDNEDLYNMINDLKKVPSSAHDKPLLLDIAARSDQVRQKRNRLVHNTGLENHLLASDANIMYQEMIGIIDDYLQTKISDNIFESNTQDKITSNKIMPEPSVSVFISTITPHTIDQIAFIQGFCTRLQEIGARPIRCVLSDFDRKDPMSKVKHMISECDAFISLGLERSHVYYYKDREGSKAEQENLHRRYTSSWLQLESGIAIALNKKIYVLYQEDLFTDGIYDRDWNSYLPLPLKLPLDVNDENVNAVLQDLKRYIDQNTAKKD